MYAFGDRVHCDASMRLIVSLPRAARSRRNSSSNSSSEGGGISAPYRRSGGLQQRPPRPTWPAAAARPGNGEQLRGDAQLRLRFREALIDGVDRGALVRCDVRCAQVGDSRYTPGMSAPKTISVRSRCTTDMIRVASSEQGLRPCDGIASGSAEVASSCRAWSSAMEQSSAGRR